MYILLVMEDGWHDPTDFVGPFDTEEDAIGYGEENFDNFETCKLTLP